MAVNGVAVAWLDDALTADPDWERLDETYAVTQWTVDRGRAFETDRTDPGTASFTIADTTGDFDPTNTGGAFYGSLLPGKQAAIAVEHPNDSTWSTVFRGHIARITIEPYSNTNVMYVTFDLVDGMDLIAACQLVPDGSFGDDVVSGNILYNEDTELDAVRTRINKVLDEVDWPTGMRNIYTGNVGLQDTKYAPRTSALTVIHDAADAEFPSVVANFFITKDGVAAFRGRFARFNPDNPDYEVDEWALGDQAAADASPTTVVPLSPPIAMSFDKETVFNAALATPMNVADGAIDTNYVTDTSSQAAYGLRTWSAENLVTNNGDGSTTALQETKLFADYVVDNYAQPRLRLGRLTVRGQPPSSVYGDATWDLICGVELGDIVTVTTTHTNGGGLTGQEWFVEGISYQAVPGGQDYPDITLTLDVSPRGYYDANPFS